MPTLQEIQANAAVKRASKAQTTAQNTTPPASVTPSSPSLVPVPTKVPSTSPMMGTTNPVTPTPTATPTPTPAPQAITDNEYTGPFTVGSMGYFMDKTGNRDQALQMFQETQEKQKKLNAEAPQQRETIGAGGTVLPETTPVSPVKPVGQSVIQGQKATSSETLDQRLADITASYSEGFTNYDNQVKDYEAKMKPLQSIINDPLASADDKALAQQQLNAYTEAKQTAIMNRTQEEANLNSEIEAEKAISTAEEMKARELNAFDRDIRTARENLKADEARDVSRQAILGQEAIQDQIRQNQKEATSLQILGAAVTGEGRMGGKDSNIMQGIIDELNYGRTILDRVKRNAEWEMNDLVMNYNRANTEISNKFSDSIPQATQDLLNSISALDQSGRLKTIQDWERAKRSLAPIINKIQVAQVAKLEAIKSNNALFEKRLDLLKNSKKVDDRASEASGYFINANGEPMYGQDGKPIKYESNAIKSTSMNERTGEMTILYSDGRYKTMQVQSPQADSSWKMVSVDDPSSPTGKRTVRYNEQSNTIEEMPQNGGMLNVPRTGNNVGQDTNNPGNIMGDTEGQRAIATRLGAIGFYSSPNGRTYAVFPDMQTGVNASMSDLQTKLSGGSSWATPNTTLAKFASGWVSGPNAPLNQNAVNNYVKITGFSANTPIKDIPLDVLAKAVFKNEGVDISKSADLSGVVGTQSTGVQGTGTQGNIADSLEAKVINIGQIAYGKNVSDSESKRIESLIKSNPQLSVQDIALAVRGLNVSDENRDVALQYVRTMDKLKNQPDRYVANIADYVNRGDYKGLNDYVNSSIETDLKEKLPADIFIPYSKMQSAEKNITEIIKLIEDNKDKIGAVDGRLTKLYKKFGEEKDIQRLQALMTSTFANLRKNFAGSAVTDSELKELQEYITGDIKEQPDNLIAKLETVLNIQKTEFDGQRQMYGVPNANTIQAQKTTGATSKGDIMMKLQERIDAGIEKLMSK